jgi:general secretion pathway protein F
MVEAGSQSGNTAKALTDAADFEAEMIAIKRDSGKGLMGALVSFFTAAAIVIGTKVKVAPMMQGSSLLEMAGGSEQYQWAYNLSDGIAYTMMAVTAISALLFFLVFGLKPFFPTFSDKVIKRIPYYRDMILSKNNYTVLYGLSKLVGEGLKLEEALHISGNMAPRGELKNDLRRGEAAVRKGGSWPNAMNILDDTDRASLNLAADQKQISRSLKTLAEQYKNIYLQRMSTFVPTLQAVAAFLLTLSGVVLFYTVIVPVLGVLTNI